MRRERKSSVKSKRAVTNLRLYQQRLLEMRVITRFLQTLRICLMMLVKSAYLEITSHS